MICVNGFGQQIVLPQRLTVVALTLPSRREGVLPEHAHIARGNNCNLLMGSGNVRNFQNLMMVENKAIYIHGRMQKDWMRKNDVMFSIKYYTRNTGSQSFCIALSKWFLSHVCDIASHHFQRAKHLSLDYAKFQLNCNKESDTFWHHKHPILLLFLVCVCVCVLICLHHSDEIFN
jgi:hypothetical protein